MSATAPAAEVSALQDLDVESRTPMKRLGSTRKLAAFSNIRVQLAEQTRVLEARAEATAGVAGELHDYCRRRADLELEYARALDKLARAAHQRHKDHKHKREQWPQTGAFACWQAALESTRALSRDHAALGELYGGPLAARLQRAADDALRLHRKCRDIVAERHEEVGAALAEAAWGGKAVAAAAAEWRAAALKLRRAYDRRLRLARADPPRHKKLKALDKELEKRRARHSEARVRALRARAEYALSLEAANATLQRYYLDDIADIMLCAEVGFGAVVGRAVACSGAAEEERGRAAVAAGAALRAAGDALRAPPAHATPPLDAHAHAFLPPAPLRPQGTPAPRQDEEMQALVEGAVEPADVERESEAVRAELRARLTQLRGAARLLRAECSESAKTLDAAEAELVRLMEGSDEQWDVSGLFGVGGAGGAAAEGEVGGAGGAGGALAPHHDDPDARRDQEDYYLAKFRAYVSCAGRLARVEARAGAARVGAGAEEGAPPSPPPPSPPGRAAARLRRARWAAPGRLGGGDGEGLPLVLTSCVRVIATYGLKHQGIFRVSGSQVEMQALRGVFERGGDPLADARDASDVHSVCGLLKLFLRSLRPAPFPPHMRAALAALAAAPDAPPARRRLRQLLATLPPPSLLLLRYLFAFLAHVTEYSEYNMMDAWNLAICLGPTLLAAGEGAGGAGGAGGGQVAEQNLANELVKRAILHHAFLFPQDVAPHTLYVRRFPCVEAEDEADARGPDPAPAPAPAPERGHTPERGSAPTPTPRPHSPLLYDDDDDDDDISEEGESGEWQDSNSAENRCGGGEGAGRADADTDSDPEQEGGAGGAGGAEGAGVRREPPGTPPPPPPHCSRRLAESTPDLVLDLPSASDTAPDPAPETVPAPAPAPAPATAHYRATESPPSPATTTADATSDSADTFLHNRDTLKKRPASRRTPGSDVGKAESDSGANSDSFEPSADVAAHYDSDGGGGGDGDGSPMRVRHTARVAAKFAELTLTGGSLKPALAAKPALLRRPTPHPRAAAPAPAPAPAPTPPSAPSAPSAPC